MSCDTDVIFYSTKNYGVITLNRERQLNAINLSMLTKILPMIRKWETEKSLIIVKGVKNFCAGGDVKSVWEGDNGYRLPLFLYNVLSAMSKSLVPYIAIIEGITMGAGLGLAMQSRYRVATDDTEVAMPEVKIGMLPDVGASYFLPKLRHKLGYYMGLTGAILKGKDVKRSGLATHYVPKNKLSALEKSLHHCHSEEDVERVLAEFGEEDETPPLAGDIRDIEFCFGARTVEEILHRLHGVGSDWSHATIETMRAACPGSLKIALRSLLRGGGDGGERPLDVWGALQNDFRLVYWSLRNHDFREGVRAALLEKDHQPRWSPGRLDDVTEQYVDGYFRALPDHRDLYVLPHTCKL